MIEGSRRKREEFTRAWYAWQHASLPTDNFRLRRRDSPLEPIECALDHIRTCVHSLGLGYLEGKTFEYGRLVKGERSEIEKVLNGLASLPLPEDVKRPYLEFVTVTKQLLDALDDSPRT